MAVSFERDASNSNMYRLQLLLGRYLDAYSRVARRLDNNGVHFEAGRVAVANSAQDEVSHFRRGLVLSKKDCVKKHLAHV